MKKLWLLFGPGGIGRGLIGPIAYQSGHKIIFAVRDKESLHFFKENPTYEVICYPSNQNKKIKKEIKDYDAILTSDPASLSTLCVSPDLKVISTSVRVDNLKSVAKSLAPALKNRKEKLIILVCENVENGGDTLKRLLEKELPGVTKNLIIPNISVDCMIPPHNKKVLKIEREEFGELWIEKPRDKEATKYLKNFPNVKLIEDKIIRHYKKKIIGVSGLHAGTAWLGLNAGHQYVYQAAQDPKLKKTIDHLIQELAVAIIKETGFSKNEILEYLNQARIRVGNPHLKDPNERFFRNLRNKLNVNERFLGPALVVWQQGGNPSSLLKIISIGFKKLIKDEKIKNIKETIKGVCQLPNGGKKLEEKIISLV